MSGLIEDLGIDTRDPSKQFWQTVKKRRVTSNEEKEGIQHGFFKGNEHLSRLGFHLYTNCGV